MANRYFNRRKRLLRSMELEEYVKNFREYHRNEERTIGEFLVDFIMLWRKAKEGGVTDFEASYRLLKEMPSSWAPWVRLQVWDTITYDPVTFLPSGYFIDLASRVFLQWLKDDGPPATIGDLARMPNLEETYAKALERVHRVRPLAGETRELGKRAMEESSMESSPIWTGRYDHETGPSGVKRRTLGIQTDIIEEAAPPVSQLQQELTQQPVEQLSPEDTATAKMGSPTHITLSDLREAEREWMEQSEDTSDVQVLPSPTLEPVQYIVISDDEERGSERGQDVSLS